MRFKEYNKYFYKIENFAYEEITQRSFSNPHPRTNGRTRKPSNPTLWCRFFDLFLIDNDISEDKVL